MGLHEPTSVDTHCRPKLAQIWPKSKIPEGPGLLGGFVSVVHPFENRRCAALIQLSGSDLPRRGFQFGFAAHDSVSIEFKKRERGGEGRPLIPIYEGMILGNVIEIGRRHLEWERMIVLVARAGLRHGEGRFGQSQVPNPGASAEFSDQILVEFKDLGERQELRRHSDRQILQCA